jgi:hypothetical protein
MFPACLTHAIVRSMDWLARHTLPPDKGPAHQRIGRRGEEDAYFHLRRLGNPRWRETFARRAAGAKWT